VATIVGLGVWTIVCGCMGPKPPEYVIGADVTGPNRELMIERFEAGKVLYKDNCSSCHGIYGHGRDTIPNFTATQIQNYMARGEIRNDQRNHSVSRELSPQQLDEIFTFLRLRRVPAK
jgi:mono/diheme cytochrome c family protein